MTIENGLCVGGPLDGEFRLSIMDRLEVIDDESCKASPSTSKGFYGMDKMLKIHIYKKIEGVNGRYCWEFEG